MYVVFATPTHVCLFLLLWFNNYLQNYLQYTLGIIYRKQETQRIQIIVNNNVYSKSRKLDIHLLHILSYTNVKRNNKAKTNKFL